LPCTQLERGQFNVIGEVAISCRYHFRETGRFPASDSVRSQRPGNRSPMTCRNMMYSCWTKKGLAELPSTNYPSLNGVPKERNDRPSSRP